jgi:aminopeptidase N
MKIKFFSFLSILVLLNTAHAWQQRVIYQIQAALNDSSKIIDGTARLTYFNNSPFQLEKLYFHLYPNAFQPGSYLDLKNRASDNYSMTNLKEKDASYCKVTHIGETGAEQVNFQVDNTIMAVPLNQPLNPGDSLVLNIQFQTKFGKNSYRMQARNGQFVATQWYPKVCVCDDHGGWHLDQHFGHEFYGEFGSYDVEITLASDFIVGATGILTNQNEMLPDSLLAKLDIKNFKEKSANSKKTGLSKAKKGETKTWKYHAENVHDFAWTADRKFRIGTAQWENVKIYALAKESNAANWQDAADVGARVIALFSRHFGRYPYPQMTLADVDQGMEYPMIVMVGGKSPTYNGLFYHEIGHNWFYGTVANNETAYPALDEGFTVYLTDFALDSLEDPRTYQEYDIGWYLQKFYRPDPNFRTTTLKQTIRTSKSGFEEKVLTHSDHCQDGMSYVHIAYNKAAATLHLLQGALGDSVFFKVMQTYFERWKFCHPYPEDFQKVVEEVSGRNLSWFFEQWWKSTKTCDYAFAGLSNRKLTSDLYETTIEIKRPGEIYMPVDLELTLADGSRQRYTIPVDEGSKQVAGIEVLPKWVGWNDWQKTYRTTLKLPQKVKKGIIDPELRMLDVNYLNNQSGWLPKIDVQWDNLFEKYTPLSAYLILWRPGFWYNDRDGLKIGVHFDGSYPGSYYTGGDYALNADIWYGIMSQKINHQATFQTPIFRPERLTKLVLKSAALEGRQFAAVGVEKSIRSALFSSRSLDFKVYLKHYELFDRAYLYESWEKGEVNLIELTTGGRFAQRWLQSEWQLRYQSTSFMTDYIFDKVTLQLKETFTHWRNWEAQIRLFLGASEGVLPLQDQFYLATANPLESSQSPWYRSKGTLPSKWYANAHLQHGGGGNLRGYLDQNIAGKRILAANLQMEVPNPLNLIPFPGFFKTIQQIQPYLFYDVGDVMQGDWNFHPKADVGFGVNWSVPFIPPRLEPVILRFDFPFFVSHPLPNEESLKFRWLMGIGMAF